MRLSKKNGFPSGYSSAAERAAFVRREVGLTVAALLVTVVTTFFAVLDVAGVLVLQVNAHRWSSVLAQGIFLLIVVGLIYGAGVYLVARLGYFRSLRSHTPASDETLHDVFREAAPPLLTILVPSCCEDARVVRRTLLSAALQEYPNRRVVLLIDDPPSPADDENTSRLLAARALPMEVEQFLEEPRRLCSLALDAFQERQTRGDLRGAQEYLTLAQLHGDIAAWIERQAGNYEVIDHADRLFVEISLSVQVRDCCARAHALRAVASTIDPTAAVDSQPLTTHYRRLLARFQTEVSSFERKRYDNLSHEPNKAMNLNSYISLLGRRFREVTRSNRLLLEPTEKAADMTVPASEYLMVIDADSVVTQDYALRLIQLMRMPGNERMALAQTPYSAFPGARGIVERIAGATTDIQYLIHQGFTRYGATYWVGANAMVRSAALSEIATKTSERGYTITRFIQDRTVIEDTESTVDLLARGWRLHNYPERLAYSETPPDFGSLLIQRRRWANGGLIILPKLLRLLVRKSQSHGQFLRGFLMSHYLVSLAVVNVGLLLVLGFPFEDVVETKWLPLTALPYYGMYAWDLKLTGYSLTDLLRVYSMNLVLIPVNLAGVLKSLRQMITGQKTPFGRTPKVQGHTRVPGVYLIATYGILGQWVLGALMDVSENRPMHALVIVINIGFLFYGIVTFIGIRSSIEDLRAGRMLRLS